MKPIFRYSSQPALEPKPGCSWADTMVLNPAIVKEQALNTIHMLFRATGPFPEKKAGIGCRDPYPICIGYATSEDNGITWDADFTRPALVPALDYEADNIYITDDEGKRVINYTNGCLEDPRIFEVEGQLYVSLAGKMFPPGPYWDLNPEGTENIPEWAKTDNNPFGPLATLQETTSVLYKLDLNKLKNREYDEAFTYICNLTDPLINDNRDVFLFPEKMRINNKMQYVMIHRPHNPEAFEVGKGYKKPSIMLAAAENLKDFSTSKATHKVLATGIFDWEEERIGASWAPIKISDKEWLMQYHGKTYPGFGYTQSFMILKENENDFPEVIHRCSERMMYAQQEWELPDKFDCPCIFTTGGIVVDDTLVISYGAADQKIGISWVNFKEVIEYVRTFNSKGEKT